MLQPTREETPSTISPNLLKNFNVYEILKPQKSNNGPNMDILIDLNVDSNNSTRNPDVNASFVDKTVDYELIDLFQNIFVSPQQIKAKETKTDVIKHSNIDYNDFFDKLESGKKIDWSETQKEKENKPSSSKCNDLNDNFNIKAKVLVPTVDLGPDSDQEDVDQQNDIIDPVEDLIDELLTSKNIERQFLSQIINGQPSAQNNTKSFNDPIKVENTETENRKEKNSDAESTQLPHLNNQISNSINNTFIVKPMIKDEKSYRKNRIVKSDREKLNFTKGPDFKEKQIVLPQIMRRLNERKLALDEEKCWSKRLILDSGTSSTDSCPNCSKTTDSTKLSSTCNTATKSMTFNYLIHPKTTENSLKTAAASNSPTFMSNSLKSSNNSTIKPCDSIKPNQSPNSLKSTAVSNSLELDTSAKRLCSPSKTYTINSAISNETAQSSSDDIPLGTLRPVILMEDCNKERLLALKRSQIISNLVRTGKLYP